MIAAVCSWHVHHDAARGEIENRLRRTERMMLSAHAMVEAYAVLTRFPPPYRVSPADALGLLQANFVEQGEMVALPAAEYLHVLREMAGEAVGGGRIYDAVLAHSALSAGDTTLLTFNDAHFASFVRRGLDVVVPGR